MNIKHIAVTAILSTAMVSAFAGDWYGVASIGQSKAQDSYKSSLDAGLPAVGLTSSMDDTDTGYKL